MCVNCITISHQNTQNLINKFEYNYFKFIYTHKTYYINIGTISLAIPTKPKCNNNETHLDH